MVEQCKALCDPELTDLGKQQASLVAETPALSQLFEQTGSHGGSILAVASPLRRTVETAVLALKDWLGASPDQQLVLHPDLQETGAVPCDTGSPLSLLQSRFAGEANLLDLSCMRTGWELKQGDYADTGPTLRSRLQRFGCWLAKRPEQNIVIISHHNLLAALLGVTFLNCEVRRYELQCGPDWHRWAPKAPLVSSSDAELSEVERDHLQVYDPMLRRKFAGWGFEAPARFR